MEGERAERQGKEETHRDMMDRNDLAYWPVITKICLRLLIEDSHAWTHTLTPMHIGPVGRDTCGLRLNVATPARKH